MLPVETCSGCTACAITCPKHCIAMMPDKDGFLYPVIDGSACIQCGKCTRVCPVLNKPEGAAQQVHAFSAKNTNDACRIQSSSGGVFSALAEYVIAQGGIVYGAALSEKNRVEHRAAETADALSALCGSKYVSSHLGDTFHQVSKQLHNGRLVLFSGTPCQVAGLLSFLGKPYDNLVTVDLICHGVPSEKVWNEYVAYQEKTHRSAVKAVSFRNKDSGWKNFSMKIQFHNGETYKNPMRQDPFLHAFLDNLCLRPSCHNCAFKSKHRLSDFTLADFWGIQKIAPEADDDLGTSLVFVHTPKAMGMLENLKDQIRLEAADAEIAIAHNSAMIKSVKPHHFRHYFFHMLGKKRFDKLVQNCFLPSYPIRLHRQILKSIDSIHRRKE